MTIQTSCCGCHVESDYGTSVVTGEGSRLDPYTVSQTDPLFRRPMVRVERTTNQSIPNNTDTPVEFDTVIFDTENFFNSLEPSRLTIPVDGLYLMGADITWDGSTADRGAFFRQNGSIELDRQTIFQDVGTADFPQSLQYLWFFVPGDYVEVVMFQTSGGPLDIVTNAAEYRLFYWMIYLGKKL